MSERWKILVVLVALTSLSAQQPAGDRRAAAADFSVASSACKAATDSGSVTDALDRLARIGTSDPNYPGLKELQQSCGETQKRLRTQEDQTFEDAKAAFQRGAVEEARVKFQSLASKKTPHSAEATSYLSRIAREPSQGGATSPQDFDNLEQARRYFRANNYDRAKPILEGLVNKGGGVGAEAKKILDQMDVRNKSQGLFLQGIQALNQKRYRDALDLFQKIEQQDPAFPGLQPMLNRAAANSPDVPVAAPAAAPPKVDTSGLQRAKALLEQKDYPGALKAFQALPDSPEARDGVQTARNSLAQADKQDKVDRMVRDGQAFLRRKEYAKADTQFRRAAALAPNQTGLAELLQQAQVGMKQSGQVADAAAYLATYLENGLREFYAGNFSETSRLLEQYVKENGKRADVALFYLGAVSSTQFYLSGEKDQERATRAQTYFAQARKLNPRFSPPKDWISPKIVALYQKAAAQP